MNIYTAHPISGESASEVLHYYKSIKAALEEIGYKVFCPMTAKGYLRTEIKFKSHGYDGFPVSTNHAIFERDKWMIEKSDVMLADLVGAKRVSIGCMMELAWASSLGTHTVTVMEMENIHRHAFVLEASDIVFETGGDAQEYLGYLISGELENVNVLEK